MEIKVLHFIPDINDVAPEKGAASLSILLAHPMGETEVHLATLDPVDHTYDKVTSHCVGNGKPGYSRQPVINLLSLQKRYLTLLYELMPDVVHIHGSYHFINSRIALWSRKRGFPVVFSPSGGMTSDFIDAQYGIRTWKMLSYQKDMTRGVSCLLVTDEKEAEYIQSERLNDRVELVPSHVSDEISTHAEYAASCLSLYHKLLDSDKGLHINQRCREALCALLHLSLSGEEESQPLCSEDILNLRSITPREWRDIYLYASEQGVVSYVDDGISRAQINVSRPRYEDVERFDMRHPKMRNPLESSSLLTTNRLTRHRMEHHLEDAPTTIKTVCFMLQNIRYHLSRHTLSLRHLCDFYSVLRYDETDEDKLADTLQRLHLYPFAGRICQILRETMYLDEGYMPVPALDDSATAKIRNQFMIY